MNIAIIPARAGSRRIPNKNTRLFCGRPILEYSIKAALGCGQFDEVMVSTDSEKIADMAEKAGASVPFMRSEETADEYATTTDVLVEVLESYERIGRRFLVGCCIYPTAPFVTPEKLRAAYDFYIEEKATTLIPVVSYSFPPLRSFKIDQGLLKWAWPENQDKRSQDLPQLYHDSGQFYIFAPTELMMEKTLYSGKTVPYVVSELETQDIDNETDWKLAELKYQFIRQENE